MKLYQCMHHTETMCHEQRRQLLHFLFLNYLPLSYMHIVNGVRAITPKLYGIYLWNYTGACMTLSWCVMNKEDNSGVFYAPAYSTVRTSHFCVRAITPKPYGIYSWNFTGAYITIRRYVMNKEDNSCIFGFWIISPWFNSIYSKLCPGHYS